MTNATCCIDGCDSPAKAGRGWCWKHYNRFRRNGDPLSVQHWTEGDPDGFPIGYSGAHSRVRRVRGRASEQACVGCGSPAADWSCDTPTLTAPDGRGYSPDPADYSPRCRPCHRIADGATGPKSLETCVNGHPYDEANTAFKRNGHRWCRACNSESLHQRRLLLR